MNPNAKNLPEFKKLIERYETITIEEIEEVWRNSIITDDTARVYAMKSLTGFGFKLTCTLCRAVRDGDSVVCDFCVYGYYNGCIDHETYGGIEDAKTPKELLKAYRARAKYMRTLIEK